MELPAGGVERSLLIFAAVIEERAAMARPHGGAAGKRHAVVDGGDDTGGTGLAGVGAAVPPAPVQVRSNRTITRRCRLRVRRL